MKRTIVANEPRSKIDDILPYPVFDETPDYVILEIMSWLLAGSEPPSASKLQNLVYFGSTCARMRDLSRHPTLWMTIDAGVIIDGLIDRLMFRRCDRNPSYDNIRAFVSGLIGGAHAAECRSFVLHREIPSALLKAIALSMPNLERVHLTIPNYIPTRISADMRKLSARHGGALAWSKLSPGNIVKTFVELKRLRSIEIIDTDMRDVLKPFEISPTLQSLSLYRVRTHPSLVPFFGNLRRISEFETDGLNQLIALSGGLDSVRKISVTGPAGKAIMEICLLHHALEDLRMDYPIDVPMITWVSGTMRRLSIGNPIPGVCERIANAWPNLEALDMRLSYSEGPDIAAEDLRQLSKLKFLSELSVTTYDERSSPGIGAAFEEFGNSEGAVGLKVLKLRSFGYLRAAPFFSSRRCGSIVELGLSRCSFSEEDGVALAKSVSSSLRTLSFESGYTYDMDTYHEYADALFPIVSTCTRLTRVSVELISDAAAKRFGELSKAPIRIASITCAGMMTGEGLTSMAPALRYVTDLDIGKIDYYKDISQAILTIADSCENLYSLNVSHVDAHKLPRHVALTRSRIGKRHW